MAWAGCSSGGGDSGSGGTPSGAGGAGGTPGTTTTSGSGAGSGTSTGGNGGGPPPVFETDIVPIFNKSCGAGDNACHSEVAYGATKDQACRGWLALKDMPLGAKYYGGMLDGQSTGCPDRTLYERLTELDAWQVCDNNLKRYIVPCDVDASYLFDKIDDGPYCGEAPGKTSNPMPSGKVMDPIERDIIRAWILAGTPRLDGSVVDCSEPTPVGKAPQPQINHPGDMEKRPANQDIPFVGVATDAEDGDLSGASLVWTSNLSGVIGTGAQFNAPLSAGTHVITLTATDSDKNTGTDSLTLYIE
jgi:hypothetical protein